jgi:cytochrome d ubiquinol oxidase subunit II
LVALGSLTLHGALWLSIKTSGALEQRARKIVTPLWLVVVALTAVSLIATIAVRPVSVNNYFNYPATFAIPVGVVLALAGVWLFNHYAQPVKAFLASGLYLFFMLAGACWSLYPTLLPATTGAANDITLSRAINSHHSLAVGLVWWVFGMALAVSYITFVYMRFRGKTDEGEY